MFVTKKCVFVEKLRCDALEIQVQKLVHKQDSCTIQIRTRESHVSILKDFTYWTYLVGHEKPSKNVISWTNDQKLDDIKLK
jgi:hypothetical protein